MILYLRIALVITALLTALNLGNESRGNDGYMLAMGIILSACILSLTATFFIKEK